MSLEPKEVRARVTPSVTPSVATNVNQPQCCQDGSGAFHMHSWSHKEELQGALSMTIQDLICWSREVSSAMRAVKCGRKLGILVSDCLQCMHACYHVLRRNAEGTRHQSRGSWHVQRDPMGGGEVQE